MKLTRKEKLLIYCLGRKTTVYEAFEAWTGKKGTNPKVNLGPWYNCKKDLIEEGLIESIKTEKGREKPITANLNNFLYTTYPNPETKELLSHLFNKRMFQIFRKYISKIVDFALDELDVFYMNKFGEPFLDKDYARSDILLLFMLISIGSCKPKDVRKAWSKNSLRQVYDEVMILTQGDEDFKDFPTIKEMRKGKRWTMRLWLPMIREFFTRRERKELCFSNLLVKSRKDIGKFLMVVLSLMPAESYKNWSMYQFKKRLKPVADNLN